MLPSINTQLLFSCRDLAYVDQVSLRHMAMGGVSITSELGGVSCLKLRLCHSVVLDPWSTTVAPLSPAEYRSLQGRGFIIFCVALAH
jgi:hypothetical protein